MNIIVIISDTFRYDNLFDRAAAMPVRTPHLDRFFRALREPIPVVYGQLPDYSPSH